MNGDVWRSREADLLAKYAERLRPADDPETEEDEQEKKEADPLQRKIAANGQEEIDFSYMNGPPPKDLLNYKNMEIEMSLWAKTGTGWMSVGILLVFLVVCFILTCILWMVRGPLF
jgi:hypothetical protein